MFYFKSIIKVEAIRKAKSVSVLLDKGMRFRHEIHKRYRKFNVINKRIPVYANDWCRPFIAILIKIYISVLSIYLTARIVYHFIVFYREFLNEVAIYSRAVSRTIGGPLYLFGIIALFVLITRGKEQDDGNGGKKQGEAFHRTIGLRG